MTTEAQEARRNYKKQYRRKNREKINAYQKKWRANNPAKVQEYQRRYWENLTKKNSEIPEQKYHSRMEEKMDDLIATVLHSIVCDEFAACYAQEDAMGELKNELLRGCSKEDSKDDVYNTMIVNSIVIAVDMSVKIIMDILLGSGVMAPLDEKRLRKILLSVVKE